MVSHAHGSRKKQDAGRDPIPTQYVPRRESVYTRMDCGVPAGDPNDHLDPNEAQKKGLETGV